MFTSSIKRGILLASSLTRQTTRRLGSTSVVESSSSAAKNSSSESHSGLKASLFNPTEVHSSLRSMLQDFVKNEVEPQALEFNKHEKFNYPLFKRLGDLGLLGITVSEEYGGSNMDAVAALIAMEEISYSDPALCLSFMAHSTLFVHNLSVNGSHEQCLKYLPQACTGEKLGGMAMTESSGGTDVLGMQTNAKKSSDGSHWILNGTKMWITNGAKTDTELGDFFLVYARTDSTGNPHADFSMFIVEKGFEGFKLGQRIKNKLGNRASPTAELVFEECKVPAENLVGKEGKAVLCMMRNLELERILGPGISTGSARRCIDIMNNYAQERKAFGKPLNNFGQIQEYIATSYAEYMAARTYLYNVANELDMQSVGNRLDTDGAKLVAVTMAKNVADRAIQTLGGYGYVSEYHVERFWRDSKLGEIGAGTLQSHHKNITAELAKIKTLPA